jgi:hypothetical protein
MFVQILGVFFSKCPQKAIRKYDKAYGHRWRSDRGYSGRLLPIELVDLRLKGTEN